MANCSVAGMYVLWSTIHGLWQYIVHAISWSSIPQLGIHQLAIQIPSSFHPAARTLGSRNVPQTGISEPKPTQHSGDMYAMKTKAILRNTNRNNPGTLHCAKRSWQMDVTLLRYLVASGNQLHGLLEISLSISTAVSFRDLPAMELNTGITPTWNTPHNPWFIYGYIHDFGPFRGAYSNIEMIIPMIDALAGPRRGLVTQNPDLWWEFPNMDLVKAPRCFKQSYCSCESLPDSMWNPNCCWIELTIIHHFFVGGITMFAASESLILVT